MTRSRSATSSGVGTGAFLSEAADSRGGDPQLHPGLQHEGLDFLPDLEFVGFAPQPGHLG